MDVLIIIFVLIILLFIAILFKFYNDRQQAIFKQSLQEFQKQQYQDIRNIQDNLDQNLYDFEHKLVNSLKQDMHLLNNTTYDRLVTIENQLHSSLQQTYEKTNRSFNDLLKQMTKIDVTQESLKTLAKDINSLQNVLTDKKSRGTWGEIELYTLLSNIYGDNDHQYMKQYRLSNGNIADAVIFASEPLGIICIDSKFPLENFNRMMNDNINEQERIKARQALRKDIIKHIDDISSKYIIAQETAEIAFMFVPAEAIFAYIYGKLDDVVQHAYNAHVFIVSPTTLMAYITAIKAIYLQQERNSKVKLIQQEFVKLSKEFERFMQRYDNINKDFEKTYKDMQDLLITNQKIINRFKQIEQVKLKDEDNDI